MQQATGARWEYVPYKGGSQAVTDTIGGQTQVIMNGLLATLPHIKAGKLRPIAISKRERMQPVPDIPTISEQGAEIVTRNPAELAQFFNSERARWAVVVKSADIRLD